MRTLTYFIVLAFAVVGLLVGAGPAVSGEADPPSGPEVFQTLGCTDCHSVESKGIKLAKDGTLASDLSKAGAERDKKWIARFLLKKVEKDGKLHKKKFRGEKAELKVIATWLGSLK